MLSGTATEAETRAVPSPAPRPAQTTIPEAPAASQPQVPAPVTPEPPAPPPPRGTPDTMDADPVTVAAQPTQRTDPERSQSTGPEEPDGAPQRSPRELPSPDPARPAPSPPGLETKLSQPDRPVAPAVNRADADLEPGTHADGRREATAPATPLATAPVGTETAAPPPAGVAPPLTESEPATEAAPARRPELPAPPAVPAEAPAPGPASGEASDANPPLTSPADHPLPTVPSRPLPAIPPTPPVDAGATATTVDPVGRGDSANQRMTQPAEPRVHIGQVDVVVSAPSQGGNRKQDAAGRRHTASRRYLRGL